MPVPSIGRGTIAAVAMRLKSQRRRAASKTTVVAPVDPGGASARSTANVAPKNDTTVTAAANVAERVSVRIVPTVFTRYIPTQRRTVSTVICATKPFLWLYPDLTR